MDFVPNEFAFFSITQLVWIGNDHLITIEFLISFIINWDCEPIEKEQCELLFDFLKFFVFLKLDDVINWEFDSLSGGLANWSNVDKIFDNNNRKKWNSRCFSHLFDFISKSKSNGSWTQFILITWTCKYEWRKEKGRRCSFN